MQKDRGENCDVSVDMYLKWLALNPVWGGKDEKPERAGSGKPREQPRAQTLREGRGQRQ